MVREKEIELTSINITDHYYHYKNHFPSIITYILLSIHICVQILIKIYTTSFLHFFKLLARKTISLLQMENGSTGRNPTMFTEYMSGTESLALIINHLSVEMEGRYYCTASYATNEILETSVTVKTYGKFNSQFKYKSKE